MNQKGGIVIFGMFVVAFVMVWAFLALTVGGNQLLAMIPLDNALVLFILGLMSVATLLGDDETLVGIRLRK